MPWLLGSGWGGPGEEDIEGEGRCTITELEEESKGEIDVGSRTLSSALTSEFSRRKRRKRRSGRRSSGR